MPATGGTIIVEAFPNSGFGYVITSTIRVPSNVTIIGRGNVRITVTADVPAFENYDTTNGNERIVISGFEIVAARNDPSTYYSKVIHFVKTKFCVIEKCTIKVIRATTGSTGICLGVKMFHSSAEEGVSATRQSRKADVTKRKSWFMKLPPYC